MSNNSPRVILKISQAAKLLNVSKDTLRRWEKSGKIKSQRSQSGYRLYDVTDLFSQISSPKLKKQISNNYPGLQPVEEKVSLEPKRLLKISEAATLLHVSKDTLRRWEQAGKIESIRTKAGYRLYDVTRLLDLKDKKSNSATKIYQKPTLPLQTTSIQKKIPASSEQALPESPIQPALSYEPKASDFLLPQGELAMNKETQKDDSVVSSSDTQPSRIAFSSLVAQTNDYLMFEPMITEFSPAESQTNNSLSTPQPPPSAFTTESTTPFISEPESSFLNFNAPESRQIPTDDILEEQWLRASDLVPPPLEIIITKQEERLLSRGNPALSFLRGIGASQNFNLYFGAVAGIVILVLILNISFYINPFNTNSTPGNKLSFFPFMWNANQTTDKSSENQKLLSSNVLAESTIAEIGRFLEVNADVAISGNLAVDGQAIFGEDITAPNILYGLTAGANVTITGDPQNPVISTTAITETDTLATVTARGAVTSTPISLLGGATLGNMLTIGQLSSDPSTASNGGIYYNTSSNKYRCYINGSWSDCDTDTDTTSSGDITTISAGNGLTGGASSGDASLAVLLFSSGTSTTTSANSGLELSSSGLGLLRGCSSGEILKWDGALWACSADAAGSGDSTVQEGGVTISSSIDTYNYDDTDFAVSVGGSVASISIDYPNSGITRDDQTESISGAWTFSDLTVLDTNVAFTGATSTLTATGALTLATSSTFTVTTNNFSQIYTSGVVTGTTTSSGFVLSAPSLTTGTAFYLTSSATSGKLMDLNATQTSGSIFSLAYGASRALTGDLTGFYLNLESGGNLDITNQNFTGTNIVVPAVTDTHTSGTKSVRGLLVNFGAGAGMNQNGAGGTLEYVGGDFQLPALTQTAGTLNAYGVRLTTPTSITTGGTAYAFYVNPTGVAAGTLTALGVGSITGGSGTEDAITIGTGWDSILKVGSNTIINGSGITQPVGGGTGISSYATGDLIYASSASTLARRAIGNTNEVLTVVGGVPTWSTISGSSCTNCLINNPTASQTISPTNDSTGLSVRQTTAGSPTADIFNITDSTGSTKYFYVDASGNVSTGSISNTTLTLTPTGNQTALTLVGTNVTSAKNQYINTSNDSGTIFDLSYGTSNTLTGSIVAHNLDLATNVTATNQSVSGYVVSLPGATNTATSGTITYKGIDISGGSLNQNGAGGTTYFIGADITMPAITQTAGGMTAIGTRITTPTSITTGGGASGLSIAASGVGAGNLYGVNIGSITGGAGSETGLLIGDGWDTSLYFNDNSANIRIPDTGTLTFVDGSGNTLCSMTDAGTTGNFSCTGINGYWTKSGTTLSPATANDKVAISTTNTTGADLTLTNTGVYTDTGIVNITANSATTGEIFRLSASSLTSGSAMVIDGRTTEGQVDDFIKINADIGGSSGQPALMALRPDFSSTTGVNAYGLIVQGTDSVSAATANVSYNIMSSLTISNDPTTGNKVGVGVNSAVTTSSTKADASYGFNTTLSATGALTSGNRSQFGLVSQPASTANSSGGTLAQYGAYLNPSSTLGSVNASSTVSTTQYGAQAVPSGSYDNDCGANCSFTQYGFLASSGTSSTNGTTSKYGFYAEPMTGADFNYGMFIGNASGGTAAASLAIGGVNTSGTYSIYSNTSNASYFAGSIGIGTTTPQSSFVHILGGNDAFSTNQLHLSSGSGTNAEYAFFGSNAASDYLRLGYYNGSTFGSVRFEGNVGVGQIAPDVRLDVNGGIQLRTSAEYNTSNNANGSRIVSTPNLHIDAGEGAYAVYLNYFGGTGGTFFCNGNGASPSCPASVSSTGVLTSASLNTGAISASSVASSGRITNSTSVSANWAGEIVNTNTTDGYGLYVRGGTASSYALIVADAAASQNLFLIHGNGSIGATGTYSSANGSVQVTNGEFYDFNTTGTDNAATTCFNSTGFIGRCSSDRRMKDNISYISAGGLDKVMALKPATFNFISSGHRRGGFIAQDLVDIIPEAATMNPDGYYSFNSDAVLGYAVAAIQEVNLKVDNALLTIGNDGSVSNHVTVQKLTVTGDADISGTVSASDFALDVTKFNRTGTLAALPEDSSQSASVVDAINIIAQELDSQGDSIASLESDVNAAQILGEQAVEHALTLDEKVASTSSTLSSLQTKIDELLSGFGDSSSTPSSDDLVDPGNTMIATDSAELNNIMVRSEATVSGTLQAYNGIFQNSLKSLGETLLGTTTVAGDISVNGTLTIAEGNKIDAIGTLFFQSNPLASLIDFFNGAVMISSNGNITTTGEVKAAKVTVDKLKITDNGSDSGVGSAVIPAGETEIPIYTSSITPDSKVFITLTSDTDQTISVSEKVEGSGFAVSIKNAEEAPITFDWFIIN